MATLAGTKHDTGLDILRLESIAAYFREVRRKYHAFEGQLKGTDSRILVAQVPGGMLTNLEGQLKQQNAAHRLDEVLAEIPRVREDLGFIPLVTPTSQIVGTQAVLNVLTGERYRTIAKETAGILKGEYDHTPVPVNAALQARVLDGAEAITCRPADLLKPELAQLEADVKRQAQEKNIQLADNAIDDVLTVALFPQVGLKFLENRHNPAAFEPVPQAEEVKPAVKAEKPVRLRRLHRGSGRQGLCGEGQRRRRYQPADGSGPRSGHGPRSRPGRRRHPGDRAAGGHHLEGHCHGRPDGGRGRRAADSGSHEDGNRNPRRAGRDRARYRGEIRGRGGGGRHPAEPGVRKRNGNGKSERPDSGHGADAPRCRPGRHAAGEPAAAVADHREEVRAAAAAADWLRRPAVEYPGGRAGADRPGEPAGAPRRRAAGGDCREAPLYAGCPRHQGGAGPGPAVGAGADGGPRRGYGLLRRGAGTIFYKVAIGSGIAPLVIFMGVGAMTDFGPLLANPRTLLLGAAAQFGIFATVLGALTLNYFGIISFTLPQAAVIGIIGGADGPTAIYLSGKLAPELLGAIAVAAYSYMALVPLIQPPIMKALTSEKERKIRMVQLRTVSKREKILFPAVLLLLVALLLPDAAPLLGMFCFGNLMRESGVVERLSDTVQNGLINIVTIFLGLSVGAKLVADKFLQPQTLGILVLGVIAFCVGTAAGVLMAKLLNLCSRNKINPLIGSAGVSAVPMAVRVSNKVGLESDAQNFLLMHAMGPNVAGVIGSAIAAGVMLKYVLAM